jgi:predicted MFS family arabinose efflux permease
MDGAGSAVVRPDVTTVAPSPAGGSGLRMIFVATFVLNGSTSVIFALISDLQDAVGLSTASLGLIAATGFIVGLAAGLVVAPWADRGWAKRLLLGGLALSAIGGIGFAMAQSLAALLLSRALIGAAAGCFLPAARAIVAGFDPARAGENLGRLARVDLAGFASGPIIGGVLFSIVGLRGTFVFFAVVAAVALVVLAPRRLPTLATSSESSRPSLGLLRHRRVVVATLLALALFLPVGLFDSLWDRYLTDLGGNNMVVGLTFLLFAIPFVLFTARLGRLADRIGHVRIALCGLALLIPCTAVYGVIRSIPVLVVLPMAESLAQAATVPASQAAMAAACPPGRAAAGQGLAVATQLAGAGIAALLAAPAYEQFGPAPLFATTAAVMALIATTALVLHLSADRADARRAVVSSVAR